MRIDPYRPHEPDFQEMRQMLLESYTITRRPDNWMFCRLDDWRYGGNSLRERDDPYWFEGRATLFRIGSDLAGFVISEYGDDFLYMLSHPDYPEVAREMLDYAASTHDKVDTECPAEDCAKIALLEEFGYLPLRAGQTMREYRLWERNDSREPLPEGFRYASADCLPDPEPLIRSVNAAFRQKLDRWWYDSICRGTTQGKARQYLILDQDGEVAAFCFASLDEGNIVSEIDPVGVPPKYQRQGLGRRVVTDCFRHLREAGIRTALIAAAPWPHPGNFLYRALGPGKEYRFTHWRWQRSRLRR